jgi:hypothetical protein
VNLQFTPQVRLRRFIQQTRKLLQKLMTGKQRNHPDFLMLDAKKTVPKDKVNRSPACLYLRNELLEWRAGAVGVWSAAPTSNSS